MEQQNEDDLHLCLSCHVTINGLENYVDHRKNMCPVKGKADQKEKEVINVSLSTPSLSSEQSHISCHVPTVATTQSSNHVKINLGNENMINPSTVSTLAVSLSTLEHPRPFLSPVRYPLEMFTTDVGQQLQTSFFGSPVKSVAEQVSAVSVANLSVNTITKICNQSQSEPKGNSEKKSENGDEECRKEAPNESMPDAATVADFFASLELKVREPNDKHPCDLQTSPLKNVSMQPVKEDPFEERLKNIKIANILTDLEFSSDSECLPSDVEELLNFSDADIDESEKAVHGGKWRSSSNLTSSHSRGKWRPGGKVIDSGKQGKKTSGGKWKPENVPDSSGGKWKPGQRVVHGIGKHGKLRAAYKAYRGLTESEDEEEPTSHKPKETPQDSSVPRKSVTVWCDDCQKSFRSRYYLDKHKTTTFHKKHLKKATANTKKPLLRCEVCEKSFNNKYNLVRHLAAERHASQEANNESEESGIPLNVLDDNIQMLLLRQKSFQCQVCLFYCDKNEAFIEHILSEDHVNNSKNLLGPLLCVRCKFVTTAHDDLVEHIKSDNHKDSVNKSDRPCVVKESRSNIPCQQCDKTLTSWVKLWQHMKSVHSGSSDNKPMRRRGRVNRPQCPYCDTRWQCEAALRVHIRRRHSGERPYTCEICKQSFSSKSDLSRHYTSAKHIEVAMQLGTPKTCMSPTETVKPSTHQEISSNKLTEQKKTNVGRINTRVLKTCKYRDCMFEARGVKELRDHIKQCHQNSHRFVCIACGYRVNHKSHWDKHCSSRKHLQLTIKASSEASAGVREDMFVCSVCNMAFDTELALHKHRITHSVTSEGDLLKQSEGDELQYLDTRYHEFVKSLPKEKEALVQCRECGKDTSRKYIVEHLRSHTSITPFHCLYCDKSFQRGSRLKAHLQIHFPRKWHLCEHCPNRYRDLKSLKQHIVSQHPQHVDFQIDYMCSTCGYKCMSSTSLRIHMTSHLGNEQKRFRCPWKGCKKRFHYKSGMNYHLRRHRQEKSYLCDQCGFAAVDRQHLNRHKHKHTGVRNYKCEYCTYSYFNSSGLRRHMRLHINTKPFRCPYPEDCQFRANSLEQIRKHVNCTSKHVCKKEYLYPCRRCKEGYKSQAELRQHALSVHSVELTHRETSICGLHPYVVQRSLDLRTVPEGQKVNPVKEQFVARRWRQTSYRERACRT